MKTLVDFIGQIERARERLLLDCMNSGRTLSFRVQLARATPQVALRTALQLGHNFSARHPAQVRLPTSRTGEVAQTRTSELTAEGAQVKVMAVRALEHDRCVDRWFAESIVVGIARIR